MMKRVADHVMDLLYAKGVRDMFMLPGGGSVHLCTSLMKSKIHHIVNHDEQACGLAAEAYARYKQQVGAVLVTSGPGAANAFTAVAEAYFNNTPVLFISGQVTRNQTVKFQEVQGLRQIGVQEIDIVPIVSHITKYAVMIEDPQEIKYHIEKALECAMEGRRGPVWLDIPVDVQGAMIEEATLRGYSSCFVDEKLYIDKQILQYVTSSLKQAKRPVLLVGQGVRNADAIDLAKQLVEKYDIPVVESLLGLDIFPRDMRNNMGNIGFKGCRHGNLCVQNADLILCVGSRMSIATVGYASEYFGREATIIVVDIDEVEHKKKTVKVDRIIHADAKDFLIQLLETLSEEILPDFAQWVDECAQLKQRYPVCLPDMRRDTEKGLNFYHVIDILTQKIPAETPIVTCTGSALFVTSQIANIKQNQRYIPSGFATMGYSLPAAIGVSFANKRGSVVAIAGDGSFQMNLQELQTVVHHQLPLKIFLLNNHGYFTMKPATSRGYDADSLYNSLKTSLSFPDMSKIAHAYGIQYFSISDNQEMERYITKKNITSNEAIIFDVQITDQAFVYTITTYHQPDGSIKTRPIEDVYPYLEKLELYNSLHIRPIEY